MKTGVILQIIGVLMMLFGFFIGGWINIGVSVVIFPIGGTGVGLIFFALGKICTLLARIERSIREQSDMMLPDDPHGDGGKEAPYKIPWIQ